MLNVVVVMVPCKLEKALALCTPNCCIPNISFINELREADYVFSVFFKGLVNQGGMCWKSCVEFNASQRQAQPERWGKFIEFCQKDGRIKVCCKDDEIMFKIPTYFEV